MYAHWPPPLPQPSIWLLAGTQFIVFWWTTCRPFGFWRFMTPPVVPRDWASSVYRGQTASGSRGDAKDLTKNIIPLKLRSQSAPLTTVLVFLWGKGCWLAHPLNHWEMAPLVGLDRLLLISRMSGLNGGWWREVDREDGRKVGETDIIPVGSFPPWGWFPQDCPCGWSPLCVYT